MVILYFVVKQGKSKKGVGMKRQRIKINLMQMALVVLMAFCFSLLFYRQAIFYLGKYPSDLPDHINISLEKTSYSLLFIVIKLLIAIFKNYYVIGLLEGIVVALSWLFSAIFIEKYFQLNKYISMIIAFGLLFLTSVYVPNVYEYFYKYTVITQPWHNITYNAMRLFAILTFHFFVDMFRKHKNQNIIDKKDWIAVCSFLLIATSIKPNFLMAFAIALFIFLLDFTSWKKCIKNMLTVGTVVLPSCVILLIQGIILYGTGSEIESSIEITLSTFFFSGKAYEIILKFICGCLFPVIVFIFNRKKLRSDALFVIVMYCVAILEAMFFMESGPRAIDGNFIWGSYISAYFLFCMQSLLQYKTLFL